MTKPEDLRIGNYLNIHGAPAPIQAGWFCLIAQNKPLPKHEPIPLTPELLEKAGLGAEYKCGSTWAEIAGSLSVFEKVEEKEGIILHYIKQNRRVIRYVHELQNLFYCLTGEELTINL